MLMTCHNLLFQMRTQREVVELGLFVKAFSESTDKAPPEEKRIGTMEIE